MNALKIDLKTIHEYIKQGGTASVNTPNGIQKIKDTTMRSDVKCVEVDLGTHKRKVAATHRFQYDNKEVYAKDAKLISTINGDIPVTVKEIENNDVYDIMIDDPHWYYDQHGVIHHNCGKSLGLCSLAADYLQTGLNVLYISMEMAESVVAKRIDANLLDISLDDLDEAGKNVSYPEYKAKIDKWRNNKGLGTLKIKEYGTGSANANTFKALLNEYKLKDGFVPDVIIVDYLGICASSRIKTFSENSYTQLKAVAEELRALATDTNTAIWSAAQTSKVAWDSSDVKMGDIADSSALAHVADFIIAVVETDELAEVGEQLVIQIKSRYGDKNINKKFFIKVKKSNQRWSESDRSLTDSQNISDTDVNTKPVVEESKRSTMNDLVNEVNENKPSKLSECIF